MEQKTRYQLAFQGFIIFTLLFSVSCANNDKVEGDDQLAAGSEQSSTEEPQASSDSSDPTQLSEGQPQGEEQPVAESTGSEEQTTTASSSTTDDELNAVLTENTENNSGSTAQETSDTTLAKNEEAPVGAEPIAPEPTAAPEPTTPPELTAGPSPEPSITPEPKAFDSSRAAYAGARVPKIPNQAIKRAGKKLNRFYFARKGDSPKKVAQLLFGSPERAKELKKANPGEWKPGRPLYYQSQMDPQDREMRSFYQEKNVPSEEVTVQRGDWLSRIAKKNLGHPGSWKEIAVINGLSSADAIAPGQKLVVYPKSALVASASDAVDQGGMNNRQNSEPPPVQQPQINAPQNQAEITPPPIPSTPPPGDETNEAPKRKAAKSGLNVGKIIEQNLFFIVVGGGISILLLALLALNKKKQKKGEDFGEDFANAPVKKRR